MRSILNEFRLNLCNVINSYDLPMDVKYYIVKDVFNELGEAFNQMLNTPDETEQQEEVSNSEEQNSSNLETIEVDNVPFEFDEATKEIIDLGLKEKQRQMEENKTEE